LICAAGGGAQALAAPATHEDAGSQAVGKDDRTLVVVAELSTYGVDQYKWLYQFLEASAVSQAKAHLGDSYRDILILSGDHATLDGLHLGLAGVAAAAQAPKAFDVFVHLHGAPGTLWFHEGPHSSSEVKAALTAHPELAHKLRAFYSTACYGDSDADDMLAAGFQVASGSRKINSNSPYDYPTLMDAWKSGATFAAAQDLGNNPTYIKVYDDLAAHMGFTDVDSSKVVHGDGAVTIDRKKP
jgi:hypothetical protein